MREIEWNRGKSTQYSITRQDGGEVMRFSWRLEDGGVGWTQTERVYIDLRIK